MRLYATAILTVCLLVTTGVTAPSRSQPPTVPKMTDRMLDQASYVELAKQWKQYIEKNGESVEALINLGMAHEYSHQKDAALIAAERAAELGPDHPQALAYYAKLLAKHNIDEEKAIGLLEKCISIEPDNELGLINLATVHLKRGDFERSDKIFKTIFEQNIVHRPLQDFAYNMLIGLPKGAVLITNGDADTFPALVLQAGMGFRKDVAVINRYLLQIDAYSGAMYGRFPAIEPKEEIQADHPISAAKERLEKMMKDDGIEVYFAPSVNCDDLGFSVELECDGLTRRSSKTGLSANESAALFLETYRLDSATDWNFAWDLLPSVSHLLSNYVISMIHIAEDASLSKYNRAKLLARAMEIAEFHDMERLSLIVKSMQNK